MHLHSLQSALFSLSPPPSATFLLLSQDKVLVDSWSLISCGVSNILCWTKFSQRALEEN